MAKIKATARWIENVRTLADNARTHSLALDLPPTKGGDDTGPTALELAIMALADCAITIFADVCKQSNIRLNMLEAVAEAEKPDDSPRLNGVNIKIRVDAEARRQLLEAAWRRTEAKCPVVSIFKDPIPLRAELETTAE